MQGLIARLPDSAAVRTDQNGVSLSFERSSLQKKESMAKSWLGSGELQEQTNVMIISEVWKKKKKKKKKYKK